MLRLHYANRSEPLVAALADDLAAERARPERGVLDPEVVVTPSAAVQRWVQIELARRTGIAANLRFASLSGLLVELAKASAPSVTVLDGTPLVGAVLAAISASGLPALRAWLDGDADGRALRLVQLAHKLAHLYGDYAEEQPELLAAFRRGGAGGAESLSWQGPLWQEVSTRGELALPLLLGMQPRGFRLPPAIHLVLPSLLPRAVQILLRRVAATTRLYVYALNPCREFWEDVQQGRPPRLGEAVLAAEADPFGLDSLALDDPPALRAWGRPARERIRLFNELSECDFVPAFVEPDAAGGRVLPSLQRDILARVSSTQATLEGDDSLRLVKAPSIRRELETLAADVWRQITVGGLAASRIGVAIPESARDDYETLLPSVFGESYDLPFALCSAPLARSSTVPRCLERLWSLPMSRLSRSDVLAVMTDRLVRARFASDDPGASDWAALAEHVGIFFGADRHDHDGTYVRRDVLSWDQGLRRVGLGGFLAGRRSGQEALFWAGGEPYLPEEGASPAFALLGRSLVADVRRIGTSVAPLSEQLLRMRVLAATYVTAVDDDDRRAMERCLGALDSVHEVAALWNEPVNYRAAWELVRRAIGSLRGRSPQLLAHGVVVGTLGELRGVPFDALYLVGMAEGAFPATDVADPLAIRPEARRAGDVSARDRDRDRFLEMLVGSRRLWISWVDRHPATGDPRSPSSVVVELSEILRRGYVDPVAHTTEVPATRARDPVALDWIPEAAREARAAQLGQSLVQHLGRPVRWEEVARLPDLLSPGVGARVAALLGLTARGTDTPAKTDSHDNSDGEITISLGALRRFLACPLQGSAHFAGLREEREDPSLRVSERFAADRPAENRLLEDVFLRAKALDPFSLGAAWDEAALTAELDGTFPTGAFFAATRKRHLSLLQSWAELLAAEARGLRPRILQIGPADEHTRVDVQLPAVHLVVRTSNGKDVRVALVGRSEPSLFVGDPLTAGVRTLLLRPKIGSALDRQRTWLRGFLDGAALAAAGSKRGHGILELATKGAQRRHFTAELGAWEPEAARRYLGSLCGQLLDGVHPYLLPCEAVLAWHAKPEAASITDRIRKLRDGDSAFSSSWGPVPHPERFPVPTEAAAVEWAERRFGPFFARLAPTNSDDTAAGDDEP